MTDTPEDRRRAAIAKIKAVEEQRDAAAREKAEQEHRWQERLQQLQSQAMSIGGEIDRAAIDETNKLTRDGRPDRIIARRAEPHQSEIQAWQVQVLFGGNTPRGSLATPELRLALQKNGPLVAQFENLRRRMGPRAHAFDASAEFSLTQGDPSQPLAAQIGDFMLQLYEKAAEDEAAHAKP